MLARIFLFLIALLFVGVGIAFLVAPAEFAAATRVIVTTPTARADVRAQYGGFQVGFGAFLLLCVWRRDWTEIGWLANTLVLAGFSLTHIGSILADGPVGPVIYVALGLEGIGAVLSAVCWWVTKQPQRPPTLAPTEDW